MQIGPESSGSCGGLFEGNGNTIYVSPTITTDYFVRGEGICDTTSCGMIAINVNLISVQPDSVMNLQIRQFVMAQ